MSMSKPSVRYLIMRISTVNRIFCCVLFRVLQGHFHLKLTLTSDWSTHVFKTKGGAYQLIVLFIVPRSLQLFAIGLI